jgi:hypothetical protein
MDMLAPSGLLRAGLALKLNQVKLATRSYLRDRTNQATDNLTSYAVAAGLFAAAGIFLIAACMVGITALFRWIEINYGPFQAFGAVGAVLLLVAAICAALAARKLKPRRRHFPTLVSRLRVAVKANPAKSGQVVAARDAAAAVLSEPLSTVTPTDARRLKRGLRAARPEDNVMPAGLILMATLLGWAALRRRQQARRSEV